AQGRRASRGCKAEGGRPEGRRLRSGAGCAHRVRQLELARLCRIVRETERNAVQQAPTLRRRGGLREQIALREPAAELAQFLELLPALDPLRDHPDVEVASDRDDRTDDRE